MTPVARYIEALQKREAAYAAWRSYSKTKDLDQKECDRLWDVYMQAFHEFNKVSQGGSDE